MTAAQQVCRFDCKIERVLQETPRDRTFILPIPEAVRGTFAFVPGQFVVVQDPDVLDPRRKAYSISSAPACREFIEVTVRDMGAFGHCFYDFPAGKRLHVEGPRGRFVLDDTTDDLLLLAGGSGITPFRAFVRHLIHLGLPRRVVLFQSARRPDDLLFGAELAASAAERPELTYVPTVTRPDPLDAWSGRTGRIELAQVERFLASPERTQWYVCGPAAFVKATLAMGVALGVPKGKQHKEQW